MINSKKISVTVAFAMAAAVVFSVVIACFAGTEDTGEEMEYQSVLFDTEEIVTIDIKIDESDFETLIENALSEEYYSCDVTVNGEIFYNAGIRAKGNTSLSQIASDDTTDRYSFKIEFDHYSDSQTCFGLDKLVLNNNYADATMMKEYLTYDMFSYLGTDASLCNYASVSVNGEYWGLYLALEAVEESFMLRNYGKSYGNAYKPENMEIGGAGGMRNADMDAVFEEMRELRGEESEQRKGKNESGQNTVSENPNEAELPEREGDTSDMLAVPNERTVPPEIPQNNITTPPDSGQFPDKEEIPNAGDAFGMSEGATSLNYIDSELSSYDAIWSAEVFPTSDPDHRRVVTALENISKGENTEEYMDVDNMLKYLAVQTFTVNLDGLAGSMAHNYYLYEDDGKLNLIPWDYNLAFGGFMAGNASETVNFPIDTPFTQGLEKREFFACLLENKEYLAKYHEYLCMLADRYSGTSLENIMGDIRAKTDELVKTDPTAFYTYEEYDAAAAMLKETINLRSASVSGQLSGLIPSTSDGQSKDSSSLIDTSDIDLSVMGTMNMERDGENISSLSSENAEENRGQSMPSDQEGRAAGAFSETQSYPIFAVIMAAGIICAVKLKNRKFLKGKGK